MPIPEKIKNAPSLFMGLELYFTAFTDLTSSRTDGPISWLSISDYCIVNEIEGEQRDDLFYFVTNMDSKYLKWCSSKNSKPPAK